MKLYNYSLSKAVVTILIDNSYNLLSLQYNNNILLDEEVVVDPIYLALKEAKGKYGSRRGSQFDSATPSPQHLSQVSLQDSGYAEATGSRGQLLGSTPQLHQTSQPPSTTGKTIVNTVIHFGIMH